MSEVSNTQRPGEAAPAAHAVAIEYRRLVERAKQINGEHRSLYRETDVVLRVVAEELVHMRQSIRPGFWARLKNLFSRG